MTGNLVFSGLDLSVSCTGLVIVNHKAQVIERIAIEEKLTGKGWYCQALRIRRITEKLRLILKSSLIAKVTIEDYAPRFFGSAIPVIELGGLVKSMLYELRLSSFACYVPPTVLKKFITGKGNSNKIQVATELTKQYGVTFENDDLYDAYGLALFSMALLEQGEFTKAQMELVAKWRDR